MDGSRERRRIDGAAYATAIWTPVHLTRLPGFHDVLRFGLEVMDGKPDLQTTIHPDYNKIYYQSRNTAETERSTTSFPRPPISTLPYRRLFEQLGINSRDRETSTSGRDGRGDTSFLQGGCEIPKDVITVLDSLQGDSDRKVLGVVGDVGLGRHLTNRNDQVRGSTCERVDFRSSSGADTGIRRRSVQILHRQCGSIWRSYDTHSVVGATPNIMWRDCDRIGTRLVVIGQNLFVDK
jgi:hypothetical protein